MTDDVFKLRAFSGFSHDFLSGRLQRVVVWIKFSVSINSDLLLPIFVEVH